MLQGIDSAEFGREGGALLYTKIQCRKAFKAFGCTALLLSLTFASQSFARPLFKWINENGEVYYSDKIPSEAVRKKHTVVNEKGMVVRNVEAVKTKEQLREEENLAREQAEAKAEAKRILLLKAERDAALLNTYTSEKDLIATRDRQINTVEANIGISRSSAEQIKENLARLENHADVLATNNKTVSDELKGDIQDLKQQLVNLEKFISERKAEQQRMHEKFAADLVRFKELKAIEQANKLR